MTRKIEGSTTSGGGRASCVVVFVHVHYLDVWNDMVRLLEERLQAPFRLVITTSLPVQGFAEPRTSFHRGTLVVRTENRGRDIRPFLIALQKLDDFEIGLKLHTKKSIHRLDGKNWRDDMLSSLLPLPVETAAVIRAMADHPKIGLLAPRGFLLDMGNWLMANRPSMEHAANLLDIPLDRSSWSDGLFAAGSMFWFRREAIAPLADRKLLELFEDEKGQTDGTLAHAVERLFGLVAMHRGHSVLPVHAVPLLQPDMTSIDLDRLGRQQSREVSPLFKTRAWLRFLVRHAPFLFRIYGFFPTTFRKSVRDRLIRN